MQNWHPDPKTTSYQILQELDFAEDYPKRLAAENDSVACVMHTSPGIIEVYSKNSDASPLVVTGGIHGDEKSGITIIDHLIADIVAGKIAVRRDVLLMYGNLQAMKVNDMSGARCIEPELGVTSNLNRCFGQGKFVFPRTYAERRANMMMDSVIAFLRGRTSSEAIDIHQSFAVPTLQDVREGVADRSEYTYAMLYPMDGDIAATLSWIQ